MTRFPDLLRVLAGAGIEFIVVGGAAATAHGAVRLTLDLDLVYRRTPDNLDRVVSALAPLDPYPRGAPAGLPFRWDRRTVEVGLNFTLSTSIGFIDLLAEITGGGRYEDLVPHTLTINVFGVSCLCLDLETLIRVKRAAGRPKDYEALAELEAIREEQDRDADEPS